MIFRHQSATFSEEAFAANGRFVAVVLNFNKRGLVGRAIRSAFAQDFPCYEILALDDASTDGSADEMFAAVKESVAAHVEKPVRVTVAVNETNRSVLGQWRQALELSDGEWFGMFCGDDESLPDRLSVAAELVRSNPEAVGVCTNYVNDGSFDFAWAKGRFIRRREDLFWPGPTTMLGCTSFWRRRLLAHDLPSGNMDDFILTWLAVSAQAGDLVWNLDVATVRYTVGTGVTTEGRSELAACRSRTVRLWKTYFALQRRGRRFGRKVWEAIRAFDTRHGTRPQVTRQIRGLWVASATEGGGWWSRLAALWTVTVTDRTNDYGGLRAEIVRTVRGRFVTRLLGPVSFVAAHLLCDRREEVSDGVR